MSKYNNKRINTPDGWFDSKTEYDRWLELKLLERAGEIRELRRNVEYELIPRIGSMRAITYRADFVYRDRKKEWREVVEDRKGYRNRVYKLKARLMLWRHDIAILET